MQDELKSSFPTLPYREEQGERFYQDVRDIERRYRGRWDVNMLADYCSILRREKEYVVNFRATDYGDLIDRQACNVTPATVLRHISSQELLRMIQDDVPMDDRDFIKFPSHTQAVERILKLVTEASRKRVEPQNRDGFIRATLESRKQMSHFESKKDYKK
ncbi:hypothetical protein AVEN_180576-1 [Araneus ventricosus]|uniref:Uncharacterized protein n=1 Tax=Araneus ventricosus TaxID=182803 RepID=A0A4Y2PLN8_ARAVE|nr:hypothetical protein AVEN_180576-1 [Araneus ventricosus]